MDFSGRHYSKDLILQTIRWYLRYNLSYRDIEEILEERGVEIDHTTPYRWVQEYAPQLEAEHRKRRKPCGTSWRMDETYIKVKGEWVYLYRAVDTEGGTVDFLLTKKRDKKAALRFFRKAIRLNGMPEQVTPEALQAVDWNRIDLSAWLALLKLQNKLPELNADTLEQLNLETLTGKGSRLDFDQQRDDSHERLKARYRDITPNQLNKYQNTKTNSLRHSSNYP